MGCKTPSLRLPQDPPAWPGLSLLHPAQVSRPLWVSVPQPFSTHCLTTPCGHRESFIKVLFKTYESVIIPINLISLQAPFLQAPAWGIWRKGVFFWESCAILELHVVCSILENNIDIWLSKRAVWMLVICVKLSLFIIVLDYAFCIVSTAPF